MRKVTIGGVTWDVTDKADHTRMEHSDDYATMVILSYSPMAEDVLDRDIIRVAVESHRGVRGVSTTFSAKERSERDAAMWCTGAKFGMSLTTR